MTFHLRNDDETQRQLTIMQNHNNIHEALLMNGYKWRFVPADYEDVGGPESGPMLTGHPDYYEYINDEEYVIVQDGVVVHREKRDLEAEKFFAAMCDGSCEGYEEPVYR